MFIAGHSGRKPLLVFLLLFLACSMPQEGRPASPSRENPVVRAVRSVSPAVVNISSEYEVARSSNPFFDSGVDPFFDSFFRDFFEPRYRQKYRGASLGSGVIVEGRRGYILTNEHVIARSSKIKVVLENRIELEAELVGAAPDFDLAVLKIVSDKTLPHIEMGNSDDIMIGETVIAIGNPFGFSHTVTTGVVSALNRAVQTEDRIYRDFIQTDASINPGNSGGPLLNINGDLIGINTAVYSKAQGIGFAIPINKAKRIMDDLIKYGEVHFPWIGLSVQDLDQRLTRYFNTPGGQGVIISRVTDNSPAMEAGLHPGDVIAAVGKNRVASKEAYQASIRDYAAGETIPLAVWKDGKTSVHHVESRLFPEALAEELAYEILGIRVQGISSVLRFRFRLSATEGVMITQLRPRSYMDDIGAREGDVVLRINDMPITDLGDFKRAVIKYRQKDSAVLVIQRGNQQYYVTVKLEA